MALATKPTSKCPFCREVILEGATKCKHCHSELSPGKGESPEPSAAGKLNTFRTGFLSGVVFMLILIFLAWKHFG